jgi:hypothetical protein
LHGRSVSKAPPPLLGFNNNVRHRGRVFHIQTEDSGVKFPRIVTHLFADGGRIVKTARTDYTEHLQKADMAAVVRGMMKEQHKGMFAALRAGELDALLESVCGPLEAERAKAPEPMVDPTSVHDLETARVVVSSTRPARPPLTLPVPAASLGTEPPSPAQAGADGSRPLGNLEESPLARRPISNPNLRKPTPSVSPPAAEGFDLDVASLDQNPPKPSRTPGPPPLVRPARKSVPVPRKSRPPVPERPPSPTAAPASGSGAAPTDSSGSLGRPQTRLAAAPPTNARSIFGDGAISEQSLDEVILSYLAEDLEEPK